MLNRKILKLAQDYAENTGDWCAANCILKIAYGVSRLDDVIDEYEVSNHVLGDNDDRGFWKK